MINDYLNQFKGQTIDDRIKKDCANYLLEKKTISPSEVCVVSVSDSKTKEILGVGGSTPNDLIMDNYGIWWSTYFRRPQAALLTQQLTDDNGTLRNLQITGVGGGLFPYDQGTGGGNGSQVQVGSGTTPPTRTDFAIETAFGTSPEDIRLSTAAGFYSTGTRQVSVATLIVAGGSGTINEATTFMIWNTTADVARAFLMARDLVSPGLGFSPAQTISIDWTWQF